MSDDPTLVETREAPEFCASVRLPGAFVHHLTPAQLRELARRAAADRSHPLVRAWRSSADAWRDRFHREEQRTAFWRSIAVGQAIGVVLGLLAWRVL
jgi:hypothetical protein